MKALLRWLPGARSLFAYERSWLPRDLVAGLVLAAALVPVGMAYAELAGLPPVYGLYASLIPLLVYAVFGPSRVLVMGPDSSTAPLVAAAIVPLALADPSQRIALAGMLALIVGVMSLVVGLARLGFVAALLSKPVRLGYMNGIAIVVVVSQLPKLFGYKAPAEGVLLQVSRVRQGHGCGQPGRGSPRDLVARDHPGAARFGAPGSGTARGRRGRRPSPRRYSSCSSMVWPPSGYCRRGCRFPAGPRSECRRYSRSWRGHSASRCSR